MLLFCLRIITQSALSGNQYICQKNNIHIHFYSWYCKNMNRSQAEKLLKTEVKFFIHND